MKPRPTTIQPGATHWNPNCKPDWYKSDYGRWMYFETLDGTWVKSVGAKYSELTPVEHLMAQKESTPVPSAVNEWDGEGLPPVGTVCNIKIEGGTQGVIVAHVMAKHKQGAIIQCENEWWYGGEKSFTPIKSEREKAIDAMVAICNKITGGNDMQRRQLGALFDAGYRKVEK